jgi:general secretion pathway protein L
MANCISYFSSSSGGRYDFDFKMAKETGLKELFDNADPAKISKAGISTHDRAILFGLGLKGFIKNLPDINLLPGELRQRPGRLGYYIMFFLVAVMIISGLTWGGAWLLRQKYRLKRLDARIESLAGEVKALDSLESEAEKLEKKLDNILSVRQKGVPVIDILRELSQIIPKDAWVKDFILTGNKVMIDGFAKSASGLIPLLESSPIIKNAAFLSAITKTKDGKEKFRIGFETESPQ